MLENGADRKAADALGKTALYYAVAARDHEAVKVLNGTPPVSADDKNPLAVDNQEIRQKKTAVFKATDNKDGKMLEVLVNELGANPNIPNIDGKTPMMYAAEISDIETLQTLRKLRADVDTEIGKEVKTTIVHEMVSSGNLKVLECLGEANGYPYAKPTMSADGNGSFPIHIAVEKGNLEIIDMLVDKFDAKLDVQDAQGRTPFFLAVELGNKEVLDCLVQLQQAAVGKEFMITTRASGVENGGRGEGEEPLQMKGKDLKRELTKQTYAERKKSCPACSKSFGGCRPPRHWAYARDRSSSRHGSGSHAHG